MKLDETRKIIAAHGVGAAIRDLGYRGANRVTEIVVLNAMKLTLASVDRAYLEGSREGWGFVERDVLLAQAREHGEALDLTVADVEAACLRGDRCYGVLIDGVLVSYGWYSTQPTAATDALVLHFDSAYAYMYKGFTAPSHRGKRLHGVGMTFALEALTAEGKRGLVSYVRSTNFASLKSCYRLGYVDFGRLFAVKLGGRYVTYATPGCKAYDFRLEPIGAALGRSSPEASLRTHPPSPHSSAAARRARRERGRDSDRGARHTEATCVRQNLYGAGLRISEVAALHIKDVDSARMQIHVREATDADTFARGHARTRREPLVCAAGFSSR